MGMKTMRWGAMTLVAMALVLPTDLQAQTPEEEVLAVVTTLFDGMREKDEAKLRSVFHPEARLGTDGIDGFIGNVVNSSAYLDEVTFDETVLIDENVAMAWTPYNLFVNDNFQHCGIDLFSFMRIEGEWKILQLLDTRRPEGCDPERRG